MENEKKIPWWVSSSRRGLVKDGNLIIFSFVFFIIATWCFMMYTQNKKIESIVYGCVVVLLGIKFLASYIWLSKNNQLKK